MNIAETIQKLSGKVPATDNVLLGTVKAVNKANKTCDIQPIEDKALLQDIRLAMSSEQADVLLVPTLNSVVMVVMDNEVSGFVAMFSALEEVLFFGGTLGGLVKIQELTNRLNTIEQAFNELLNHYKTHNHLHPNGNTTGLVVPSSQSSLVETTLSDLENPKIKQ